MFVSLTSSKDFKNYHLWGDPFAYCDIFKVHVEEKDSIDLIWWNGRIKKVASSIGEKEKYLLESLLNKEGKEEEKEIWSGRCTNMF